MSDPTGGAEERVPKIMQLPGDEGRWSVCTPAKTMGTDVYYVAKTFDTEQEAIDWLQEALRRRAMWKSSQ